MPYPKLYIINLQLSEKISQEYRVYFINVIFNARYLTYIPLFQ